MEDYDGLSAGPNQEGQLKISYQGWKQIPSELVKFANTLVSLDISFNQVTEISASFGSLILLEVGKKARWLIHFDLICIS